MCGITGIYNLNGKRSTEVIVKKMADTIAHRGPDDEGFFVDDNIALGHRRLSILDLSSAGHQPMFYGNFVIVFNGEIYNYLEIRQELIAKGYIFKSETDTEVILASYQEWGPKCLDKFNGMWAFVIYDRKKKTVFGARDRLGVKPFYYYLDKEKFLFGSEIKAILAYPEMKARPNDRVIWDYLIAGLVDHSDQTFFKDVFRLPAGHYFTLKNHDFKIHSYWDLKLDAKKSLLSQSELNIKFKELFFDSVKLRLRSDVPIGTCLSGGLDSSSIVCALKEEIAKEANKQVGVWQKTFSACYDDKKYPGCDERKYIKEVIKKTQAKSYCVFPSGASMNREMKKLIWHHDSPFNSMSVYAQWTVFRLAKSRHVKVVLDGQGSDELLAGYQNFFGIYFIELLRQGKIITFWREIYYFKKNHPTEKIGSVFYNLYINLILRGVLGKHLANSYKNRTKVYDIFAPDFAQKYSNQKMPMPSRSLFQNSLYTSVKVGLPSLLKYEDRNSMAFGIESRIPFLDYRLVEFAYNLPANQKIHNGQSKWILRQAFQGLLPEKIRLRQDKIGFAIPGEDWIKKALRKKIATVFASKTFLSRGYVEPEKVKTVLNNFMTGKISDYNLIWRLYNLEMWFRIFVDKGEK